MQIESSILSMNSRHERLEQQTESERLRIWIDPPASKPQPTPRESAIVTLSAAGQQAQPVRKQGNLEEADQLDPVKGGKLAILAMLIERLTGKKIQFVNPKDFHLDEDQQQALKDLKSAHDAALRAQSQGQRAGFGVEYDHYSARIEQEQTTVTAEGIVKTRDGQEIKINITLNMSRRFVEENSIQFRAGDARLKDPLVINFDGNATQLTGQTFSFDIDSDGNPNQLAVIGPNSGFLALDKNSDGTINNGNELFGTQSGNGLADLASYDEDGNHWIDQNDSIYNQLRIWSPDAGGKDQLIALGERGIGAIYLEQISSPFDLTNSSNTLLGQVGATGIYLSEDGRTGTVQQLNLVA